MTGHGDDRWPNLARAALAEYPRLQEALGNQLIARAAEQEGLMNPLVRSLCGDPRLSELAYGWELRFKQLPPDGLGEYRQIGVGSGFDEELENRLAELRAVNTFRSSTLSVRIEVLPRGWHGPPISRRRGWGRQRSSR